MYITYYNVAFYRQTNTNYRRHFLYVDNQHLCEYARFTIIYIYVSEFEEIEQFWNGNSQIWTEYSGILEHDLNRLRICGERDDRLSLLDYEWSKRTRLYSKLLCFSRWIRSNQRWINRTIDIKLAVRPEVFQYLGRVLKSNDWKTFRKTVLRGATIK